MSMGERNWFITRLNAQIKEENDARKKANKQSGGKKVSMPKTRKRR